MILPYHLELNTDTQTEIVKIAKRNHCSVLSLLLLLCEWADKDTKQGITMEESIENHINFMQGCVFCTA